MKRTLIYLFLILTFISCEEEISPPSLSQVTVSRITNYTADVSCIVTDDGNSHIDKIGICWALTKKPTIKNSIYEVDNSNTVDFQITNLRPKSTYYARAFAINEKGFSYSGETSFTTQPNETNVFVDSRDGQAYKIVKIGEQWWFAENLNYKTESSWYFNEDSINYASLGRLYTHESSLLAVPEGWKLPSDNDWAKLERHIGINNAEIYETHWRGFGFGNYLLENREYDFDIIWSGKRDTTNPIIYSEINSAYFWSSTKFEDYVSDSFNNSFYGRQFSNGYQSIKRTAYQSEMGFSVRCIKE